jgi:hypothetical protein
MSEKFSVATESVATGTDKTLTNLFHAAATPTCRGQIKEIVVGGVGAVSDNIAAFFIGRTTGVGTEGSGLTPNNLDPVGPAGEMDAGLGVYSVEPTYTAGKQLLRGGLYHRNTFRWVADLGWEFKMTATQNNGAGLKSTSSGSTQAYSATILFEE